MRTRAPCGQPLVGWHLSRLASHWLAPYCLTARCSSPPPNRPVAGAMAALYMYTLHDTLQVHFTCTLYMYTVAGAMAASEAEQALADSWQQLIMLRLKSQKLQLRQQANPMTDADMERVEVRHPRARRACCMARLHGSAPTSPASRAPCASFLAFLAFLRAPEPP